MKLIVLLISLVTGVDEIAAPGVPGPLCVFGPKAVVVVSGGYGKQLEAPVVAAAPLGKGRVVAFGHGGYFGQDTRAIADTGKLLQACVAWAGRGKSVIAYRVKGFPAWDGGAIPTGTGVIVMDAHGLEDKVRYAAVDEFVRGGGGLVTASLGWGWLQVNPGKDLLTDHAGNRFLKRAGIVWSDGYLKRTSPKGYAVRADLAPQLHAYAAAFGDKINAQSVSTLTTAIRAIPADDTLLLPQLRAALEGVPVEQLREVRAKNGLARVALALQIHEANQLPPEKVRAHPWAKRFPGKAPGELVTQSVAIDTSIPRWHSTGLYARAGTVVTITVPEAAANAGLAVRIGAHSDRLWQKAAWQRAPEISRRWKLAAGKTDVASAFGGLIYIEVPKRAKPATYDVTIGPALPAPLYIHGTTTLDDWKSIRKRSAPWAELGSDRLIITVPSRVIREMDDPRPVMEFWNRVLDASADLAARPRKRASPERFVVDKQISVGYMHSGYPLMAHLDAAAWLPNPETARKGNWGLFHEIGHNHQHRDWTFQGTTEVTVNLFTLYAYETVCKADHARANLYGEHRKKTIRAYLERGAKFEEWSSKPFLALLMYMQLQEAFGWDTFQNVFRDYRGLAANERPKTEEQKRDQWMVRFSRKVGKNLGPFFEAWGVPTSAASRASLADLPAWMPPDWPRTD